MSEAEDNKLHEAVRLGDTDLVEEALGEGLDPDMVGMYQWCPLHEAASNGDLEILQLLLKYKADPNKADGLHLSTPLHYAAKEGHVECLRELVRAGGRYDAENSEGVTPLDIAEGECQDILDRERTRQFLELSLADTRKVIQRSTRRESLEDVSCDPDERFDRSLMSRSTTPTAWENIEVIQSGHRSTGGTGTGLLQCSFEYNSKTEILKIRVWMIEEILMPPAEFSTITRIYVKGHLLPDKKGDTKRKTEELKIEDTSKMGSSIVTLRHKSAYEGFKAIYLPSTFKFANPLVYRDVRKDAIANKTVHLEVCVRMRYSTRSLPVASFQIPLKEAVRKLRKEKFRLLPCINYTIPDNVHSADPSEFIVVVEGMYANRTLSNPVLQKRTARVYPDQKQARASSDINLQNVRCHSVESIPTVSLSISSEGDEHFAQEDFDQLTEVTVHRSKSANQDAGNDSTVVDIHREDTARLSGGREDDFMVIKVESGKRTVDSHATINLSNLVSETSFSNDIQTKNENENETNIPQILVTTPDGKDSEVESVAVEMRHLMQHKKREKASEDTERKRRTKRIPDAKPGHVIDMRMVHSDQIIDESNKAGQELGVSHKWAVPSSSMSGHVYKNEAFEKEHVLENGRDAAVEKALPVKYENLSERNSRERKNTHDKIKRNDMVIAEVNYGFISEKTHEKQGSRKCGSPASPNHGVTEKQGPSTNDLTSRHSSKPVKSSPGSATPGMVPKESPTSGRDNPKLDISSRGSSTSFGSSRESPTSRISLRGSPTPESSVFINRAYEENETAPENVRDVAVEKTKSDRQKSNNRIEVNNGSVRKGQVNPEVNFGFISEESPRERRSPKNSPARTPKQCLARRNPSPSFIGDHSFAAQRSHHSKLNGQEEFENPPFHVAVIDETPSKEHRTPGRRVTREDCKNNLPSSPVIVQEVNEVCNSRSKSGSGLNGRGRFEVPKARRSMNFDLTPPLTKGLRMTELVDPRHNIARSKVEEVNRNMSLLQNGNSGDED